MSYENTSKIGVHNHYGPRGTGQTIGVERSTDGVHQMSVTINGETLDQGHVPVFKLPEGALILRGILTVDEALTGLTALTVEGENGDLDLTTLISTVGTVVVDDDLFDGDFDPSGTGISAETPVTIEHAGSTTGKATLLLEYVYKRRS